MMVVLLSDSNRVKMWNILRYFEGTGKACFTSPEGDVGNIKSTYYRNCILVSEKAQNYEEMIYEQKMILEMFTLHDRQLKEIIKYHPANITQVGSVTRKIFHSTGDKT